MRPEAKPAGNQYQSTGGMYRTRLGTLSFGIGILGFIDRRVSSSRRDTAQSRNGLSSAGAMYQGATGVEHRVRSRLKASWYSSHTRLSLMSLGLNFHRFSGVLRRASSR